jgi:zinc protease
MTTVAHRGLSPVRTVLGNGATVLAQPTSTHEAVTLLVSVAAGSGLDPSAALGTANFVARTIDRGTASRSADALAEALDARGVSLSVGVTRHLMTLSCTCLSADVEDVLALVADVVIEPTFPPDQVEKRRTSIVTSLRQDEDNPAVVATETLMGALYPGGHPYGRLAKGTLASVQALTRDDLRRFHQARFGASTLRVVLVGDVVPERAVSLAESAFGRWGAAGASPLSPPAPVPAATRSRETRVVAGKAQSDIAYGFVALARDDPRYYAASVMNTVLGQYALGGRLGDNIRERQGMAYYVFSGLDANVAAGPLVVRAGVNPDNVDRAIEAIDDELTRMAREGATPAELADTKSFLIGSMPRALETNAGIASFLHSADVFGLGLDFDRRLPDLIASVTLDDVHDAARSLLAPERATIVVAGPAAGEPAA